MAARGEAAKTGGLNFFPLELGGENIATGPPSSLSGMEELGWSLGQQFSLGSVFCPLGSSLNRSPESPVSRLLGDSRVQG